LKLYTQRVAPNPTKLDLYLAEKAALGQPVPLERISVNLIKGEQRSPAMQAKNPLSRVPFLELDDGSILPESLAIIEYLEERWPHPSLIGATLEERAHVRALERSIDFDILYSVALIVHATNSPAGYPKNPGVAAWFSAHMTRPLAILNHLLSDGRPFVAGPAPEQSLSPARSRAGSLRVVNIIDQVAICSDDKTGQRQ
jgi:glutathione S-transferase